MKSKVLALLLTVIIVPFALTGCDVSHDANISTTQGSPAATVDNPNGIGAGAAVTSTLTPAGETVSQIASSGSLTLAVPATATGTGSATFKNTVAYQFKADLESYTQTVVNFVYTEGPIVLKDAGNVATLTADLGAGLQAWGLDPVNPQQHTALGNIISIASKVGSTAASLTSTLTGIQTTGVIPTVTTSSLLRLPSKQYARREEWGYPTGWSDGKEFADAK